MSKKAFAIFIIFILIVMGILGWYFFVRTSGVPSTDTKTADSAYSDLFPFGKKPAGTEMESNGGGLVTTPSDKQNQTVDIGGARGSEEVLPRLRHVSTVPTAGAVVFDVGSTTLIRYIERATGHIN